jgi:hypothetical protein
MRHVQLNAPRAIRLTRARIGQSPGRRLALVACLLAGGVGMAAAVRAYNNSTERGVTAGKPVSVASPRGQQVGQRRARYYDRLALQPAADRIRRRLGRRFQESGREISESAGDLTIGAERHSIVIIRSRDDDGERVAIGLDGGPPNYAWNANDGAQTQGKSATGIERSLIERVVLDSPEQFVLAQLRGSAYYTAARSVRPAEAGDSEDYQGPIWDVIQITEANDRPNKPESASRLFYINNATGLIDRTLSRDQSGAIAAKFADWVNLNGEMLPLRTTWTLDRQVIMELVLSSAVTRAKN